MASCCGPQEYDGMFNSRFARRTAARYRRRGLDRTAARMVTLLERRGVRDASVLEIGGGVGDLQVELLRRGAGRATNLELSSAYESEAQRLLDEEGLADRVDRRILDIAQSPDDVEPADIVILHRVVCCYSDYAGLLGAAADHTRRQIVFSHPPRNLLSRAVIGSENAYFRLSGTPFRVFVHPPRAMLAVLAEHGLRPDATHRGRVWQITTASR